jgi:hypothetical protein
MTDLTSLNDFACYSTETFCVFSNTTTVWKLDVNLNTLSGNELHCCRKLVFGLDISLCLLSTGVTESKQGSCLSYTLLSIIQLPFMNSINYKKHVFM